jgi:hypothetical protein
MRVAEIERIMVPGQPGHKRLQDPISMGKKIWAWWCMPVILTVVGSVKQDCGPGQSRQKVGPFLQNNQSKKGWRCGSKLEALS